MSMVCISILVSEMTCRQKAIETLHFAHSVNVFLDIYDCCDECCVELTVCRRSTPRCVARSTRRTPSATFTGGHSSAASAWWWHGPPSRSVHSLPNSTTRTRIGPDKIREPVGDPRGPDGLCRRHGHAMSSAWFWLGGSMPPCRLRRRNFWKFDYEMVHSEVYLNKYVVSIAPSSTPACRDCSQNIT